MLIAHVAHEPGDDGDVDKLLASRARAAPPGVMRLCCSAVWMACSIMSGHAGRILVGITGFMTKQQTNGKIERLSPERLAELRRPAAAETLDEKRAAVKRATEGLRVKVRVTPDMYGRR